MSVDNHTPLKRCSKCPNEYPATIEYFPPRKSASDGLRGTCRNCYRATKRAMTAKNREHYRAKGREWIAKNPEKKSEMSRRDYQKNLDARRAKRAEWRSKNAHIKRQNYLDFKARNPELVKERRRAYHLRYPYKTVEQARRRRASIRGVYGEFTRADELQQYQNQAGLCWWCGEHVGSNYHVDHYIPIARGGDNTADNIVIACPMCNSSRRDLLPEEWEGRPLWRNYLT